MFFSLHIYILNLSFRKSNKDVKNIRIGMLNDIMTGWLVILFINTMIKWFTEIWLKQLVIIQSRLMKKEDYYEMPSPVLSRLRTFVDLSQSLEEHFKTSFFGMMEIDRKEKCRKRKISKGINVNDGANVRVRMRVEKIFTSIYSHFHCFWLSIFV